jgi:hypothetical protein
MRIVSSKKIAWREIDIKKKTHTTSLNPFVNTPAVSSTRPTSFITVGTFFRRISTWFFVSPSTSSLPRSAANSPVSHPSTSTYPGAPLGWLYLAAANGVWCVKNLSGIDFECLADPEREEAAKLAELECMIVEVYWGI